MLRSMTGFGAGDCETDAYKLHIELKAVNQRYLDIELHMPYVLNLFEEVLRKTIKESIFRGKVDVNISFFDKRNQQRTIRVDKNLAIAYHRALNEMSDLLHLARPDDVGTIAKYPEVLQIADQSVDLADCQPALVKALEMALKRLLTMREAEGANIYADFQKRLERLEKDVQEIAGWAPQIVSHYRERLQKTLEELLGREEIDETRIIQETAIYADKVNYTEEIVRLQSHFKQFSNLLVTADEPVGRRLDFLVQEMNREINTIASKANCTEVAQLAVDVKSEIEKLREQLQNIE